MTFDEVQHNTIYEYHSGRRIAPVYVRDKLPDGVLCVNLDTKREIFIKRVNVGRRLVKFIENLSEWRLHNG